MRLIDADAFREGILAQSITGKESYPTELICDFVDEQPTIEAVPVVHGEWENVGDSDDDLCFRCPNCKTEYSCDIDMNVFANFCPNCGCDMRGVKNAET